HHRHRRALRQSQLPLSWRKGSRPWSALATHLQNRRQVRHGEFSEPRRAAQSRAGSGRVSSLSGSESCVPGGERKDLPGATGRGNFDAGGKKTAQAIQQEVHQEISRLLQVIFTGWRKKPAQWIWKR